MAELIPWVRAYLEQDEDIIVPVKKMWNAWQAMEAEPSLEEFTRCVLADEEIEEMPGVDHARDLEDLGPEELEEHVRDMEEQGFFSGPRVKLKSREITLEHVGKMLKRHNDRMEWALRQARHLVPEDASEAEEERLLDVIKLAKQLRRTLRQAGLEPPEDEWSRRPTG